MELRGGYWLFGCILTVTTTLLTYSLQQPSVLEPFGQRQPSFSHLTERGGGFTATALLRQSLRL